MAMKSDFRLAILSAIKYIESHPHEDLSMQAVASHISFSQYHFHRIFSGALGESVKEYVRKRWLMVAADQLVKTDRSVLELALTSGFDSQEAFTRAFKKMFGTTPGAYRKRYVGPHYIRKPEISEALIHHLRSGITMEPKIVNRGPELAIGISGNFIPGQTEAIAALWDKFVKRRDEIKHRKKSGYELNNSPDFEYYDDRFNPKTASGEMDIYVPLKTKKGE